MQKNIMPVLVIIFLFSISVNHDTFYCQSVDNLKNKKIRAVSLKRLQQGLQAGEEYQRNSHLIMQLGGIKEIIGFIQDEPSQDIILLGYTDNSLPVIYTEDLVVALRNSWLKYADLRGNTYYYSNPGCSIDPDQKVMHKLSKLGEKVLSGRTVEESRKVLSEWHNICRQPQNVRIMGIPFNSHFAEVMVQADYDMKNIVNGTDSVEIFGLHSLMEMKETQVLEKILNKKPISITLSMNRFWFYPGENKYEESEGMVLIRQCPVLLLTENEYNSSDKKEDPLAIQFAHNVTVHYGELAKERLIYKELESLFRLVCIAKILKYMDNGFSKKRLTYFLNDFLVPEVQVESSLPGKSVIREFEHKEKFENGYSILHMWLPSCGGVDITINPDKDCFQAPSNPALFDMLKRRIINQKDSIKFYWDVEPDNRKY